MRISELAGTTGVSIASLKYYLREGLLHPGASLSATRSDYDDSHVERVRLVRTLIDVGRLSIERVREVVSALEHPPATRHELLGTAHHVLRENDDRDISPAARELTRLLAVRYPEQPTDQDAGAPADHNADPTAPATVNPCDCESPAAVELGRALTAAELAGWPVSLETLQTWAAAVREIVEVDVAPELARLSPADALRHVVVGNVLTDPIVIALRRVEQERLSAERLGADATQSAG